MRNDQFSIDVEDIVWELDVNHIDALNIYCERRGIESETIAPLVRADKALLAKVRADAERLRYLKAPGAKIEI